MQRLHYFDTSFLVPLLMEEATSHLVMDYVSTLNRDDLATSSWTRVEFNSLLGIRVRSRRLEQNDARRAERNFADLLASFTVVDVMSGDFELAREMLREHHLGLRAGDALHLAIARNRDANEVLSLDKALLRAGRFFGVNTTTGASVTGYDT